MVRINPGSNVHGDNEIGTATPGMVNVDIPEPKLVGKGVFQCPVCGETYNSREAYDSHAMTRHQTETKKIEPVQKQAECVEVPNENMKSRTKVECTPKS